MFECLKFDCNWLELNVWIWGVLLVKLLAYFLINNGTSGFTSNTLLIENIGLN